MLKDWKIPLIYRGSLEQDANTAHDMIEPHDPPGIANDEADVSLAVALPDHRFQALAEAYGHAFTYVVPVESSCRRVTVVTDVGKWGDHAASLTLDKIRKASPPDEGPGTAPAQQKPVAVLLWDDVTRQSTGQVHARFRDIRCIHNDMRGRDHVPFDGIVVCIHVPFRHYQQWAQGNVHYQCEALDTLWEHGILATVPVFGEPAWCPTQVKSKSGSSPVWLITHEVRPPDRFVTPI